MPVLIDTDIPPVCLVVDVIHQFFRHLDSLKLLEIQPSQGFLVLHVGVKIVAVQIVRQVNQVFHVGGVFSAVNDGLKLLQIALAHFREQTGQMIEFVDILILSEIVIEPQHIAVKTGNEELLVAYPVHADAL